MARPKKIASLVKDDKKTCTAANKWSRLRRIEFIDFRLCVDGKINRADLVSFFNISVPQASLDLSYYRELVEKAKPSRTNLIYDKHLKVYVRADDFIPIFPNRCSPEIFFSDLKMVSTNQLDADRCFFGFTPDVGVASLHNPRRIVSPEIMCNLIDAMRAHLVLHIVYSSVSSNKKDDYLIAPHSFGFNGLRWHVRAYCYDSHTYKDYVLTRIVSTEKPRTAAPSDRFPDPIGNGFKEIGTGGKDDKDWNEIVVFKLKANPALDEGSRRGIEMDYGIEKDGILEYEVKKALGFYALRNLMVAKEFKALPDYERHLVLINEDEVYEKLGLNNKK